MKKIKTVEINTEVVEKDVEFYVGYTKNMERKNSLYVKCDMKRIQGALYYVELKSSPEKFIPAAFYRKEDAEKLLLFVQDFQRISEKRWQEVFAFIREEIGAYVDFLTLKALMYHSQGNWIEQA